MKETILTTKLRIKTPLPGLRVHLFYDIIVLVKGCDFYSYVDSKDTDFPIRRTQSPFAMGI